ncbi:Uncharacterised protein [Serratia liquefaciens]|nr:Uncharacterised protein [Serratia liquefaciens]
MSWSDFEYSTANGQPVTLYEFVRGDTQFFRYTNADQDINAAGAVWQQQAISDGGLSVGAGDSMDITLPTTNPVAMLFRGLPPSQPVRVRIHRWHVGDSQGEFRTVWIGSITEVKRRGDRPHSAGHRQSGQHIHPQRPAPDLGARLSVFAV